jgi:hypothetical protein
MPMRLLSGSIFGNLYFLGELFAESTLMSMAFSTQTPIWSAPSLAPGAGLSGRRAISRAMSGPD